MKHHTSFWISPLFYSCPSQLHALHTSCSSTKFGKSDVSWPFWRHRSRERSWKIVLRTLLQGKPNDVWTISMRQGLRRYKTAMLIGPNWPVCDVTGHAKGHEISFWDRCCKSNRMTFERFQYAQGLRRYKAAMLIGLNWPLYDVTGHAKGHEKYSWDLCCKSKWMTFERIQYGQGLRRYKTAMLIGPNWPYLWRHMSLQ